MGGVLTTVLATVWCGTHGNSTSKEWRKANKPEQKRQKINRNYTKNFSSTLWVCRGGIRDGARRNAGKPCDTCICGISPSRWKRHKSGFDHRNDHRQKKLYFYRSPVVSWQKSEYPGIAKLVSRLVWDQETVRSSRTTRTKIPLKSLISEGFFLFFVYCGAKFTGIL